MRKLNSMHLMYTMGLFVLASIAGLWSWNTLAELFSLPQVQYKHVLAALFLSLILRWVLSPHHHGIRRPFGGSHEDQSSRAQ